VHVLMLYALWLFLAGSWTQTVIGMTTFSTVLHYPNAFMAASGLVCAASMMVIVAANLLRIVLDAPGAVVPGDPDPDAPASAPASGPGPTASLVGAAE